MGEDIKQRIFIYSIVSTFIISILILKVMFIDLMLDYIIYHLLIF